MFVEVIIMFNLTSTKQQEREMETLMEIAVMAGACDGDGGVSFSSSCLDVLMLLEMKLWWWRWHGEAALRRLWRCGSGSPPGGGYGHGWISWS